MASFQVPQSNNSVLLSWSCLSHLTWGLGLIEQWKPLVEWRTPVLSEHWETLYWQPVILEHNRVKQPYEKCSVGCLQCELSVFRLLSFSLLEIRANSSKTLMLTCADKGTRINSLEARNCSFLAHTYTLTLTMGFVLEVPQSCCRIVSVWKGLTSWTIRLIYLFPVRQVSAAIII